MTGEPPVHWRSRLEARALRPAITTDAVAVATINGTVAALDLMRGKGLWQTQLDETPVESPVANDEIVVVATENGSLFGFDTASGERRFRFDTDAGIDVAPAVAGNVAFVADTDATVYAIRCDDGTEEWRRPENKVNIRRIAANDSLAGIGFRDGTIEGIDRDTVKRVWHEETDSSLTTGPKLTDSVLTYGTQDGRFMFSDLELVSKGRGGTSQQFERPVRDIGGDGRNVVVVTEDTVFRTVFDDDGFSRWDRWSISVTEAPLSGHVDPGVELASVTVTDGVAFVGAVDGSVVVLDAESGDPWWGFEYNSEDHAPQPVARDGRVVLGGSDRAVYSFLANIDLEGTVDPTLHWGVDSAAAESGTAENRSSMTDKQSASTDASISDPGATTDVETSDRDDITGSTTASDSSGDRSPEELRGRIEHLEQELDDREDRIDRLQAELDRVGDRDPLAADLSRLVSVYDRLASISVRSDDAKAIPIARSVRGLWSLLELNGVEGIDPDPGSPVDPAAYEVIETEATPEPADYVVRVESSGFRLDDEVLSPARVVASNGAEAPTANSSFDGEPVDTTGPVYVYEGTLHRSSDDLVRVLTPPPDLCEHDVERAFVDAIEKWRTISSHSKTVEVVDYGEVPHAWAAVSWEPYEPLSRRIDELDLTDRLSIIEDVADAIRNADKYNIRHRRLRPSSVWVRRETGGPLEAAVADWEVIAVLENDSNEDHLSPYFAPEQLTDDPIGGYTDIYRLGALAYYLLTDVPPFEQDDLRSSILDGSFRPPSAKNDQLNSSVDEVVSRAMAREPSNRYNSSYNFRVELADAI